MLGIGDAGDHEGVDAIVRVGVGVGEAFVDENGQAQFVGFLNGVVKGVIRLDPPVHLRPIENVFRSDCAERGIVKGADAMFKDHLKEMLLARRALQ